MTRCTILLITLLAAPAVLAQYGLDELPDDLVSDFRALRAEIESDPEALEDVIKAGRERAIFCNTCHGDDGNAERPTYPALAGQNAAYLLDQIEQFAAGTREKKVMNVLAATFSNEEKVTLALYYTNMERERPVLDADLAQQGAAEYQLRCAQCHGADGRGQQGYARIAGQQPGYIAKVLREYRSGESPRRLSPMYGVAAALDESVIDAIAHYAASLR
jgi:cytochrome c553